MSSGEMVDTADPEPVETDRAKIEALAGYGVPEAEIAIVLEIAPDTLRLHYLAELRSGHIKANAKVAENLYRRATGEGREAVTAAIFWLKTRARWKETSVHELGGSDGGPLRIERVLIDPQGNPADLDA